MLSVNEARQQLLNALTEVAGEQIPLGRAASRILAEEIQAEVDLPPFSNSSMDGFAIRVGDTRSAQADRPVTLKVVGDIPAGHVIPQSVRQGEAMRIMTGAPVPPGADAVVPVEDTDFGIREAGVPPPEKVLIYRAVEAGAYIRRVGEDLSRGDTILPAGRRLRAQDIALLASLGKAMITVRRRPKIAIFSTGDELLPVEAELTPGKIRESNGYALAVQVASCGGAPLGLGIVPDEESAVRDRLSAAVDQGADLIVSSAGVSVGAFDFVREVVESDGKLTFWRVNMRPGKPLAFGAYRGVPFVGLPGNPVSAFVGFEVFLRPAISKMAGDHFWQREVRRGVLHEPVESDGRESYLRARVRTGGSLPRLQLTGHQGSGNIVSLVQAEALIIVPAGVTTLPAGAEIQYWPL